MSNYTDKNKIEKYLQITIPSSLDSYLLRWLTAVDLWIEKYCGRKFKDGTSATRYYDGSGNRELYVDNFESSPTEVQILDADGDVETTLVIDEDYRIGPWNETTKNILVLMQNGRQAYWPARGKSVKVTAGFGLAAVPADIELAATMLGSTIVNKGQKGGDTTSERVGDVAFTYKDVNKAANAMGVINILDQNRFIAM